MSKSIEQLERELRIAKEAEKQNAEDKKLELNYERFKNRPEDWVVGKAHMEPDFREDKSSRYFESRNFDIPFSVSIHGNSGSNYRPKAPISSATYTYFHNVITNKQRSSLQTKLTNVVRRFVSSLQEDLYFVIEIMGLQSDHYWISQYPVNKRSEVRAEVYSEQYKVLSKFKKKDWLNLPHLSHGNSIAARYLKEKHPEWLEGFSNRATKNRYL